MFKNLPEFDKDYLESSAYGKSLYDRDYVGAFFTALLPDLKQKLETAKADSPQKTLENGKKVHLPTQETVAYGRLISFLEFYLASAKPVPLPNVNSDVYKDVFSSERLERLPEHKRWEAALAYMIMCLSNQIHTVVTSIQGSNLPKPLGDPWPKKRQDQELKRLDDLLTQVNDLTENINEEYFPFTCG